MYIRDGREIIERVKGLTIVDMKVSRYNDSWKVILDNGDVLSFSYHEMMGNNEVSIGLTTDK